MTAYRLGDRVWYRPTLPGYGYRGDIPAIVRRVTPARVRVLLLTHGGTDDGRVVNIATTASRLFPRTSDAPIDAPWRTLAR